MVFFSSIFRLVGQLSFEEERLILAKDANIKNEDTYDIYDPRNPLNKRRRGEGEGGPKTHSNKSNQRRART